MKQHGKKIIKALGLIVGSLLLLVVGYIGYLYISYNRIPDKENISSIHVKANEGKTVQLEKEYTALTYNIGFGAYSSDYSFFMDGGKYSRAFSKESVITNTEGALKAVQSVHPEIIFMQEVDTDSTRSYHVNQYEMAQKEWKEYDTNYAINYDSAYLFYPFYEPHGKSKAGMATFTKFPINSAIRRSLPISTSFYKFIDLDRCYTITRVPVENGKELCLYNVHLSAYTNDDTIVHQQIQMLAEDFKKELQKGNYIVCGGDFNQDLLEDSSQIFGTEEIEDNWAKPFQKELLPKEMALANDLLKEEQVVQLAPTCRNANEPYKKGSIFVIMVDGFLISNNIRMIQLETIDTEFEYSDHNPVRMKFMLLE